MYNQLFNYMQEHENRFEAAVSAHLAFNAFYDELEAYRFKITEQVAMAIAYMQDTLLVRHKWTLQDAGNVVAMSKLQREGELTYRNIYAIHNIYAGASGEGVKDAGVFMNAVHNFAPAIVAIHELDKKQNELSQACTDTLNAYRESIKASGAEYRDVDGEAERRYKESKKQETEIYVKEVHEKQADAENLPVGFCLRADVEADCKGGIKQENVCGCDVETESESK